MNAVKYVRHIVVTACFLLLSTMPCNAQKSEIYQLFNKLLSNPTTSSLPSTKEFFTKVTETTVNALPESELNATLTLAKQCFQDPRPEVRRDGVLFFIAVDMRIDSAKLLEPYVDDLVALSKGPQGDRSLRRASFYILGSMNPKLPPKAVAALKEALNDSQNTSGETITIAASLIKSAPTDAATLHQVLTVASSRNEHVVTDAVLRQLGLSRCTLPEVLSFLSANLDQQDPHLRAAAMDAVSRLDKAHQGQFSSQLARIASDPAESQEVRNQAREAMKP